MISSTSEVSSTQVARHFSDYLSQVRYGGKTIIIEKNRHPVAELRPISKNECTLGEFLALWSPPSDDPDFADDLEQINATDVPPENPWA